MARLNKEALIKRAIDAIVADGWAVARLGVEGAHPARFDMDRDGVRHTVRLYIWNLSHGGKSRSEDEFRIQVTGIDRLEPEADGRTLILGWSEELGVFAGFDVQHRLGTLGSSPSIQINATTLAAAGADGAAKQDKTKGEWAVAVRADRLGRYVQHQVAAHSGDIAPLVAGDGTAAADPLASEIAHLANDSVGFDLTTAGEADLRARIISGVDEVLAALGSYGAGGPAQIGHNKPPEPVDENPPLGPEIESAAHELKDQLTSEVPDARAVGRAGAFLAWAGSVLTAAKSEGGKVFDKTKDLAREYMAKALWGVAGTLGVTFKEEITGALRHIAGSILIWLQHVSF